jgi:hypothetical protein
VSATITPIRPDRPREIVITRDVRFEIRIPFERFHPVPSIELSDMTIVNDSGPQTFIEELTA